MPSTMINVDTPVWMAMSREDKLSLLRAGLCMRGQGIILSFLDRDRRTWGARFRFGLSPVVQLAQAGEHAAVAEALALGASPFARDSEGDGLFEFAAIGIDGLPLRLRHAHLPADQRAAGAVDPFHEIAKMAWEAGRADLDPTSPSHLGDVDSAAILHDIAYAFYSRGLAKEARAAGIPLDPSWMLSRPGRRGPLRPRLVHWGRVDVLEEFRAAVCDFAPWEPHDPDSSDVFATNDRHQSPWHWLHDTNPDMEGVARFLLSAGCDPRRIDPLALDSFDVPLDPLASTPLDDMAADPRKRRTHAFVSSLLLALDEREALESSTAVPSAPRQKPAL